MTWAHTGYLKPDMSQFHIACSWEIIATYLDDVMNSRFQPRTVEQRSGSIPNADAARVFGDQVATGTWTIDVWS
jgi:hypothetical protein